MFEWFLSILLFTIVLPCNETRFPDVNGQRFFAGILLTPRLLSATVAFHRSQPIQLDLPIMDPHDSHRRPRSVRTDIQYSETSSCAPR